MRIEIMFGSYQLKHSLGYIDEHIKKYKNFVMYVNKNAIIQDGSKIIMTRIQSKDTKIKKLRVYIRYLPVTDTVIERPDHVLVWYCECKNGARTRLL